MAENIAAGEVIPKRASTTIVDVSKLAGVSIATVSRVINQHPRVSPAAVKAVERAMADLSYTPPPAEQRFRRALRNPRALAGIRHGNIALLFPDVHDAALRTPLSARLMHGVSGVLVRSGLSMLVTPLRAGDKLPVCITERKVDGVIIRGATDVHLLYDQLADATCVWMLEVPEIPGRGDQVLEDTAAMGNLAVKYLLERKCRRLAAVNREPGHPSYDPRVESFCRSASKAGIPVSVAADKIPIKDLIARLLDVPEPPTGFFVPAPYEAITETYRALESRGLRVGKDVHLVPCDYDPSRLSALHDNQVNLDIQPEAIARAAAEMLIWRLAHPQEPQRRLMIAPRMAEQGV